MSETPRDAAWLECRVLMLERRLSQYQRFVSGVRPLLRIDMSDDAKSTSGMTALFMGTGLGLSVLDESLGPVAVELERYDKTPTEHAR